MGQLQITHWWVICHYPKKMWKVNNCEEIKFSTKSFNISTSHNTKGMMAVQDSNNKLFHWWVLFPWTNNVFSCFKQKYGKNCRFWRILYIINQFYKQLKSLHQCSWKQNSTSIIMIICFFFILKVFQTRSQIRNIWSGKNHVTDQWGWTNCIQTISRCVQNVPA